MLEASQVFQAVLCAWGRNGWIYAHLPLGLKRLNNQMMIRSSIYACFLLMWVCVCVCSVVCVPAQSCMTLCYPVDCSHPQAPLSMEFSRQEYWSGLPFPTPRYLPDPVVETASLESPALAGGFYIMVLPGKHLVICRKCYIYNLPFIWDNFVLIS